MSVYTVSAIELDAVPGWHSGTGTHHDSKWTVVPETVPGTGPLSFLGRDVSVTSMLFQLDADVVPNWFGVAVPSGLTDFTRPHVFFHPMPAQAGYVDAQYAAKTGKWPQLFYYMERLGYQLDAARRAQVIVMPFLTQGAADTGVFAPNWHDILRDVLTLARAKAGTADATPLDLSQVVVSSFSIGIVYLTAFRHRAPGLEPLLAEAWDFDGRFSSSPQLSTALVDTPTCRVTKYDQVPGGGAGSFHVPLSRWSSYVRPPTTGIETHRLICDFMFMHGATISEVGATIAEPAGTSTGGTGVVQPDAQPQPPPAQAPQPPLPPTAEAPPLQQPPPQVVATAPQPQPSGPLAPGARPPYLTTPLPRCRPCAPAVHPVVAMTAQAALTAIVAASSAAKGGRPTRGRASL